MFKIKYQFYTGSAPPQQKIHHLSISAILGSNCVAAICWVKETLQILENDQEYSG